MKQHVNLSFYVSLPHTHPFLHLGSYWSVGPQLISSTVEPLRNGAQEKEARSLSPSPWRLPWDSVPFFLCCLRNHEESMFSAMCVHHDVTPPRWTENNGPHSLKPLKAQSKTNFSFFKLFISSILSQWWKFYMPSTHLPMYLKGEMSFHDIVMASLTCSSSLSKFHSDTYTLSIQACFGRSKLQGSVVD